MCSVGDSAAQLCHPVLDLVRLAWEGRGEVAHPVGGDHHEGQIVPAGPGSIAVIGAAAADLGQVTADVLAAVVWL